MIPIVVGVAVGRGRHRALVRGAYNRLVGLRNQVANAWNQIDVQLKRRHDLIPNLVETVKGAMSFERGTLEAVVAARGQAAAGIPAAPPARRRARTSFDRRPPPRGSSPARSGV